MSVKYDPADSLGSPSAPSPFEKRENIVYCRWREVRELEKRINLINLIRTSDSRRRPGGGGVNIVRERTGVNEGTTFSLFDILVKRKTHGITSSPARLRKHSMFKLQALEAAFFVLRKIPALQTDCLPFRSFRWVEEARKTLRLSPEN